MHWTPHRWRCARGLGLAQVLWSLTCSSAGTDLTGPGSSEGGSTTIAETTGASGSGSNGGLTSGGSNSLPPVPVPLQPANGATDVPRTTSLCWTEVEDPDGDALRYRVWVDGTELVAGLPGDPPGFAGGCTQPLLFDPGRTYAWEVEAFEENAAIFSSGRSAPSAFTTVADSIRQVVFADDFDDDLGWELGGDAATGAWVRADPVRTVDGNALAQPGSCGGGLSCMITGQNPDALIDSEDVSGGVTWILSPAFDLSSGVAASVQLRRFFYQSVDGPSTSLRVELLRPDPAEPGGYAVEPLEVLDDAASALGANLWHAREHVSCAPQLGPGMRLRISASDGGDGILEAAIDSVVVNAELDPAVCGSGIGSVCDPNAGPSACTNGSSCCPQGAAQRGVYRCSLPVAGLDYNNPTASPDDPGNGPIGCDAPDLIIDDDAIDPFTAEIMVGPDSCVIYEGCVGGPGLRKVLRFPTLTPNVGSRDIALGVPANQPDLFHYSACHAHYHFDHFASYEVHDDTGVVATGHKQAFCLTDWASWAWPGTSPTYDCATQGIGRGFSDLYAVGVECQWVDVTELPPGPYTLRVDINVVPPEAAERVLIERDYGNNTVEVPFVLE